MLNIKFNADYNPIKKKITEMNLRIEEIKEVAPLIHKKLEEDVLNRFEKAPITQLGGYVPGNVYWLPLKKKTLQQRPDRLNKQILTDTGRLKESLKVGNSENIAGTYYKQITFGSKVPYAKRQQSMRKYLFLHPELMKEISKVLKLYVKYGKEKTENVNFNNLDQIEENKK